MFRSLLTHHQGAHKCVNELNIGAFLYKLSLITWSYQLFCLLGIKEFHILLSTHYNWIITISAWNGACYMLLYLIISFSVYVCRFWRQVLLRLQSFGFGIHLNLIQLPWIWRQQFPPKRNDAEECYWNIKHVMCEKENKYLNNTKIYLRPQNLVILQ